MNRADARGPISWRACVRSLTAVGIFHGLFIPAFATPDPNGFDTDLYDRAVLLIITVCDETIYTGTGFLVSSDGVVVTNAHVASCGDMTAEAVLEPNAIVVDDPEPGKPPRIADLDQLAPDEVRKAQVLVKDASRDLAVLKVAELRADRKPLRFSTSLSASPPKGLKIFSSGYPGGSRMLADQLVRVPTRKDGTVSLVVDLPNGTRVFETDADVAQGMSGGPVADLCGNVVGINVAGLSAPGTNVGGLGFAQIIRGVEATDLLKRQGLTYLESSTSCAAGVPARSTTAAAVTTIAVLSLAAGLWLLWRRTSQIAAQRPSVPLTRVMRDEISRYLRDHRPRAHEMDTPRPQGRRLIVGRNGASGVEAYLRDNMTITIGRGESSNLIVGNGAVSRQHCRISLSDGRLFIEDLGSSGGTFVYRNRIDDASNPSVFRLASGQRHEVRFDGRPARFYLSEPSLEFELM